MWLNAAFSPISLISPLSFSFPLIKSVPTLLLLLLLLMRHCSKKGTRNPLDAGNLLPVNELLPRWRERGRDKGVTHGAVIFPTVREHYRSQPYLNIKDGSIFKSLFSGELLCQLLEPYTAFASFATFQLCCHLQSRVCSYRLD